VSEPDKPDRAHRRLSAEKLVDEEADRLAKMSDEDFEREMGAKAEPSHVPTAEELLARGAERAAKRAASGGPATGAKVKAVPAQPRRRQWIALLAAAAIGGLVVAVVMNPHETQVSHPRLHDDSGGEQEPTAQERAARMREEAFAACGKRRWEECESRLNLAKKLDPAGDADPRVQAAHEEALAGLHLEAGAR
jgi:hypothetical protein